MNFEDFVKLQLDNKEAVSNEVAELIDKSLKRHDSPKAVIAEICIKNTILGHFMLCMMIDQSDPSRAASMYGTMSSLLRKPLEALVEDSDEILRVSAGLQSSDEPSEGAKAVAQIFAELNAEMGRTG